MSDGTLAGAGAVEGVKLLNNLVEMLKTAQAKGDRLGVAEILEKLPPEAFVLSGRFIQEIDDLRKAFANEDLNKTIDQLQTERQWWELRRYKLFRSFRPKIQSISDQLDAFLSDVVAIAHCKEAESSVARSFSNARERSRAIERDADFATQPVGKVLEALRGHAKDLQWQLQEMMNHQR
jgi:hypothetical protein